MDLPSYTILLSDLTKNGLYKCSDVLEAVKKATNSKLNATRLEYQLINFNLILLDLALTGMPPMPGCWKLQEILHEFDHSHRQFFF